MKDKNNKLFITLSFILIIVTLIINNTINNYYKSKYNTIINKNITSIISLVKNEYQNVNDEDILRIINGKTKYNEELKKYGIKLENVSIIKDMNNEYNKKIKINNVIIILLFMIYLIIFIIYLKLRKQNLKKLEKTIIKINNKDYSLDLKNNSEDELSNLKNELYKTTIMLKEDSLIKERERNAIKNGVSNISHQIKTPLTSVSILVDNILEDKNMSESIRNEFLFDIRKSIDDVNFLVMNLLKLSRFDAGVVKFNKEKINILELINKVKERIKILILEKNINFNIDIDKKINFMGDYNWEVEALTNIIKNCIEYSNINSDIDINVIDNSFYTKIIIKDYGKGMNKEEIKNIFKKFYKGENSDINSFGIGLSLSKSIIEMDNGFIKVKSEINKGTIFEIKYMKK